MSELLFKFAELLIHPLDVQLLRSTAWRNSQVKPILITVSAPGEQTFNYSFPDVRSGHPFSYGTNPAIRPTAPPTPGLRYKNLGKSGLRVSNVGLGTWSIFSPMVSDEQAESIIKLAADSGINLFDLSEAHSGIRAELELGRIIQKYAWKRTSYIVATKIYWSTKSEERGLSRKHIIESVKASLQRLQVDYIDIILVHKADAMCPMEGNAIIVRLN